MKIIEFRSFNVYVYANDHAPPHCHVRFKDGSEIIVDLPLLIPRFGVTISRNVEEILIMNLDKLCDAWDKLNSKK